MKAIIFDFDGVIVDSETYWKAGEVDLFKRLVPGWRAEDVQRMMGRPLTGIFELLVADYGLAMSFDAFFQEFSVLAENVYAQCEMVPGIPALLDSLRTANVPIAIASSAKQNWIHNALWLQKIEQFFPVIVSADDLQFGQGKPMPIPYLLAAQKLKQKPEECIAIEDAANGVTSAKAAGMTCIAYRWKGNQQDLSRADMIIEDMHTLTLEILKAL